jgi:hypothetical protein
MAAPVWTSYNEGSFTQTSAKCVVSGGTTANDAPTGTEGVDCRNLQSLLFTAEADSTRTLTMTGTWECWWKSPLAGGWARFPEFDLKMTSLGLAAATFRRATFLGPSAGIGFPQILRNGYVCWVPNAVAVSAGGITGYIDGGVGGRSV